MENRGTDWVSEIKQNLVAEATEINQPQGGETQSLALPCEVDFFILRKKWETVQSKVFLATAIKELICGPWLIRIKTGQEALYFCGNDEVYQKLADKQRRWIHDFVDPLWNKTVKKGMHKTAFWQQSLAALFRIAKIADSLNAIIS